MAKHLGSKDHRVNTLKYKSHVCRRMIHKSFVVYITASLLWLVWFRKGRQKLRLFQSAQNPKIKNLHLRSCKTCYIKEENKQKYLGNLGLPGKPNNLIYCCFLHGL